ncbi:DUF4232 domain-containing protein [Actinoplanes couchii]|uniref:DUF4232 domain-containing protein n=1 Tax=Actinoplanes couchii TaxID=403638 RepID=A0ABQ3XKI8_9ACTN|nr:DUF4232 domain-containing protein [Actinoplanes couchii]MDR6320553.1 putative small lipoprotein YifL [Actinoplanes couchii]GID58957.1 hypothetical protein Aco03nite_073610 [Actinoplanes couchii]
MRNTLTTTVPALVLLTALSACGSASAGTTPTAEKTTPSAATTTPGAETTTPAAEKTAEATGTAECADTDLKVSIAAQGTGETDEKGMVVITNEGRQNCTVHGWLTFALVNAAGEAVPVPTEKVNEPGPAETVEIKAGGSAFAGIKWTRCDKGDVTCGAGNSISWKLDEAAKVSYAELEGFPAPEKSNITMTALKVGTVQPSNQGVTAW